MFNYNRDIVIKDYVWFAFLIVQTVFTFYMKIKASPLYDIEFRESDVSPGRTEVKQGKFVEYIFPTKGYFRETNKSQNINTISLTPKFTFGIIQIKVKSQSTSFQWLVQYKINVSV